MAAIRISPQRNGDDCADSMHMIPCKIQFSGNASVKEYFGSTVRDVSLDSSEKNGSTMMQASFRGRPLKGTVIEVPNNYEGMVLKEEQKTYSDEEERTLIPKAKFEEFVYWNLDNKPTENDNIFRAMKWIQIAEVLHGNEILLDQDGTLDPTPTDR